MIKIESGQYQIGDLNVECEPFTISDHALTNAEFMEFVLATSYVSDAERIGSSFVFVDQVKDLKFARAVDTLDWWYDVDGASWRHPFGPGSTMKLDHPVVHVTYDDALAYCAWAGFKLPNEIQWEIAARGGLEHAKYVWGDEEPIMSQCNIWFGTFPNHSLKKVGTVPSVYFEPNNYGLYNMAGNVWEWCSNEGNIPLPEIQGNHTDSEWVAMRGGSFLCHASYCNRYSVGARNSNSRCSSASNVGFRVIHV